jgi:hypothetical protein
VIVIQLTSSEAETAGTALLDAARTGRGASVLVAYDPIDRAFKVKEGISRIWSRPLGTVIADD